VHVKILAKPVRLEDLIDAYDTVCQETRQELGCEYSEVIQNIDNSLLITLVEKFSTYQAFKTHMQMPALRHFIDDLTEISVHSETAILLNCIFR
jgi:quinol monooxygenase YgiN